MGKKNIWITALSAIAVFCLSFAALFTTGLPAAGAGVLTWEKTDADQPLTVHEDNGIVSLCGSGSATAAESVEPYRGVTLPLTLSGEWARQAIDYSLYEQSEELTAEQACANFAELLANTVYYRVSIRNESDSGFDFYLFPVQPEENKSDYAVAFAVISEGRIAAGEDDTLMLKVAPVGKFDYQSDKGFAFAHVVSVFYDSSDPQAEYGEEGNGWYLSIDGIGYRPDFGFADLTPVGEENFGAAKITVTCAARESDDAKADIDCTAHFSPMAGGWYSSGLKGSFDEQSERFTAEGIRYATGFFNYQEALTAEKKTALSLRIDQYPGFHSNNVDGWVGLKIARKPFGFGSPDLPKENDDVVMLLLRIKSKTSIGGEGGYANAYQKGQNIGPVETNLAQETVFELENTESGAVVSINGTPILTVGQWKDATEYYIGMRFHTNPDTAGGNPDQWKIGLRIRNDGQSYDYPSAQNLNGWGETDDGVLADAGSGRVRLTGREGTEHTYTYSVNRYDIHKGFRVRFSFEEVPGYRSEDGGDYWLGLFLQDGTANGLTQNKGFKFLLRPNSRSESSSEKLIVERNCFAGSTLTSSGTTALPVDVLKAEHYLSVFDNGRGYQVMFDGMLIDYTTDPNAYSMYTDLNQVNIVFNAYVNSADRGRFVVNVHGVDELSEENGFLMLGNSDQTAYGQTGITVAEKRGAGMSGENLFYLEPLSLDQALNHAISVTLSLDQVPAYHDPTVDCYLAIGITTKKGYVVETAEDCLAAVLRVKDRSTVVGSFGVNAGTVNHKVIETSASPSRDIVVTIGYNAERAAVIMVNGEVVSIVKNISIQKFIGKQGYLGISTRNTSGTSADSPNWSYTVKSVEVIETVMPLSQAEEPEQGLAAWAIVLICIGSAVVLAAGVVLVLIIVKKKRKQQD